MAEASIAAIDLVRAMDEAEDLLEKMKKVAEDMESIWPNRVAIAIKDYSWASIRSDSEKLVDLSLHSSIISEKTEISQNRFDDFSRKMKNITRCIALLKRDALNLGEKAIKVQGKKKIKLEEEEIEKELMKAKRNRGGGFDDEEVITKKKSELKKTKQDSVVVSETLKFLKDARDLCDKAIYMIRRMFALRMHGRTDKSVVVVEMADVSTIKHLFELTSQLVGARPLIFAIGRSVGGEFLDFLGAQISKLDNGAGAGGGGGAIDVKPGDCYELSFHINGLSRVRLTRVDASSTTQ